ncbi:MAG TPA: XdhC family protein [Planctomycetaceae bacterium]|jgi:xanthine dehydrogenase accessory factor
MRKILEQLERVLRGGKTVAYTALVETRGSTPQKAGAAMLVYPDGSQFGTLGGGCVEAEVKRRALRLIDQGGPELLTFQLDDNYGWDDGLICGGRMKMLVDPLRPGDDVSYFEKLNSLLSAGTACTEAVVIDPEKAGTGKSGTGKSGSGQAGDRFLLNAQGEFVASRARAAMPDSVASHLRPVQQRPRAYVEQGISYLPFLGRCRLLIVGAGHVGQKVAQLAAEVDFDVWVVDDREEYASSQRFPTASRLLVGPVDTALSGLDIDANTYCLIVTRGHNHDEEALYHLAETPATYVGMIGSHRKIKLIFDDLLTEGISREALARVKAPLGFDIGSQTVPEIAVSIVAELIAHRNLGGIPAGYQRCSLLEESRLERGNSAQAAGRQE